MTDSNVQQSEPAAVPAGRSASPFWLVVALGLIVVGLYMLLSPLFVSSRAWDWTIDSFSDLQDAKIKAMLKGTSSDGVRLARQGDRPVSLISRQLELPDNTGSIAEVVVSLPDARQATQQRVVVLWPKPDDELYHFDTTQAMLGPEPTTVRFSLSVAPQAIRRIGFQFPDANGDVLIQRMGFPSLGVGERLGLAIGQAREGEPFQAYSINFLRGPSILGNSVTSYLFGLLLLCVGIAILVAAILRRRPRLAVVIVIVVGVWAIEDARATWNLVHNERKEAKQFEKLDSRVDKWAAAQGYYEVAWAGDLLAENADPGSTFCVVSDDTFAIPHRLAYLVAPRLAKIENCQIADFIVVLFSAGAHFDPDQQILTLPDESTISARPVAQLSDNAYILHNNRSKAE